MKRSNDMKQYLKKGLLLGALSLAAGPALALTDYYLIAKEYQKQLPDGSSVTMWGYAEDPGGACYNTTPISARRTSPDCLDPLATAPGSRIAVPADEPDVRLRLTNLLSEPTSIVITGQELPFSANNNGPTWDDNSVGSRGTNMTKRVRSYGREAGANGGRRTYVWRNSRGTPFARPGTFMFHSGTDPQKQVYMGLYGAITKDAVAATATAPAEAYAGVPYDNEVVLFYSDIDPAQNEAVAAGGHTTSIHYHAKWFLVNGEPYSSGECAPDTLGFDVASGYPCPIPQETADILAGAAGESTLIRFLSAASETHVPTLQGMHMMIHAEDGNVYNWQDGTSPGGAAPREQYSVMLPPLKTKDAVIEPQVAGRYAVYDGNGYMTNPTDADDFDHQDPVGGMLRFLDVSGTANQPPTVVADTATAISGRTITIDVLANDSDPEGQAITINSFSAGIGGTADCGLTSCDFTSDGVATAGSFTYDATDGTDISALATVSITVVANNPPVAADDSATTEFDTAVVVNVLANDSDLDGDALSIASIDTTGTNGTVNCDNATGDCTFTPTAGSSGGTSFAYVATDGDDNSNSATVNITVNPDPGNSAPIATDDTYSIGEASILNGNVITDDTGLGPDSDADGDPLTVVPGTVAPTNSAAFTISADGSFTYRSVPDYNGPDTFTYVVTDGTDNSNVATVTIDVTAVNDVPVANDDTVYLNSMGTTSIAAPGVLANDTDPDGDTLTAQNGVVTQGDLVLNTDGSLEYTPEAGNIGTGTLATFTYVANDGFANSAPATVSIDRKLSVSQAICEVRGNGNCNWRIQGNKSEGGRVEAWIGAFPASGNCNRANRRAGNCIRSGNSGPGAWSISVNNSRFNTAAGPINLRIYNVPDSELLQVPTSAQ